MTPQGVKLHGAIAFVEGQRRYELVAVDCVGPEVAAWETCQINLVDARTGTAIAIGVGRDTPSALRDAAIYLEALSTEARAEWEARR